MDTTTPNWLDGTFLASALQEGETQETRVTVENFSVSPAVAAGNNYTSHLYRVTVDYKVGLSDKIETKSLIVKMPIQKGVMQDVLAETDFFTKEPTMYSVLLPKMNKICQTKFGPVAYHCSVKLGMVIEDLKPEGYVLIDRFKQLDFVHCKHVMKKLGRFHATSVVCHHDDSEMVEAIGKETFYNTDGAMSELKTWMTSSMTLFTDVLQEMEVDLAHIDLITARIDKLWDSVVDLCQTQSTSLNVLNHGDCWSSNMLFKYDEQGEVNDVMFIDYQMLRYSSPITDIIYFIYTSANEQVRENKLQDLYDIYLETLNETLEKLDCDERLTREEFNQNLKSATDYVLVVIGNVLPFTKCETENALVMEDLSKDDMLNSNKDERFIKLYRSERFQALLPALVRQYISLVS